MSEKDRGLGAMLIFCIVFLGSFFALITIIPSGFFYSGKSYSQYNIPDYFTKEDLENIKYFKNDTITRGGILGNEITFDWDDPDPNFKFHVYWYGGGFDYIAIAHVTWSWWIFGTQHFMDIETEDNRRIELSDMQTHWNSDNNVSRFRPVYCKDITVTLWFTDTNHTRNNISEAWEEGALDIGIGFGFDDYEITINAWEIVGRLLAFQSPEIFGTTGGIATTLNFIIALPIWSAIAYLVYRLILMAIPFLGG